MENKKIDLFHGIWMLLPFFIITLFIVLRWIDIESFLVFFILFLVTLTAVFAAIVLIILAFRNLKNKWNKAIIIWGALMYFFSELIVSIIQHTPFLLREWQSIMRKIKLVLKSYVIIL